MGCKQQQQQEWAAWVEETVIDEAEVTMDDPNITMEEYIRLEEEKARKRGKVYNWETATYALSCKPMVSTLNDNQIDFRISCDKSDNKDYTVIYDKNSFSYKIIFVNDLKTNSENDNDKVNMPSFPSFEPTLSYFDDFDYFKNFEEEFPAIVYNDALTSKLDFLHEPTISLQHINEFDETSLFGYDGEEQNIIYFNDLVSFNVIYPDDLSNNDNDNDKIDIEQSLGDLSIEPLPTVTKINVQWSNKLLKKSHDTTNKVFKTNTFKELGFNIVTCNYLNKGTPINLIKNLYVPFDIPIDPKLFYKDGIKLGQV
uniref:Uncharacterized protein n=1 Tax=Tanacetum cinerariifolium TaxID=118510 RepID=A0A699GKZ3_TANCI|nr:hypothetical protein [Tanacetum cinerariifolium]